VDKQTQKLAEIDHLIEETNWNFAPTSESYQIEKQYTVYGADNKITGETEHRVSIIQMIHMPGMATFYNGLNTLLGMTHEAPPVHTTLFTGGNDSEKSKMGIGINTYAELRAMNPKLIN
jgi:hypothetical protein